MCCIELFVLLCNPRTVSQSGHPDKPRILCLGNEEVPLSMRKLVLEGAGYSVLTAIDTTEALELFNASNIDLVVAVDVIGLNDFIHRVRQAKPQLPIMILSGGSSLNDEPQPPDYYLHKLEGSEELLAKVEAVIRSTKASGHKK
jgi:DNA-binding response OmpR family regulator